MDGRWRIRAALPADAAEIADAEARCFTDPWSRAGLEELFENRLSFGLVAEAFQGGLAGYLFARVIVDEAEILNLAVIPEYRTEGLGGRLLDGAVQTLWERGARSVFLEVRDSNHVARALYEGRGFRLVGVRADYYRAPREQALVYRLARAESE